MPIFLYYLPSTAYTFFCFLQRDYSSSESEIEEHEEELRAQVKQRKFDPELWKDMPVREVERLPCGIDGLTVYSIKNVSDTKQRTGALSSDGRKWKKSSVTSWKQYGPMRFADCRGSNCCRNEECPFRVQYGVINRTQFKREKSGKNQCAVCGHEAEIVYCEGRRYVRQGKNRLKYSIGVHTLVQ